MQCVTRALVTLGILEEVELVIVFGIIPRPRLDNLRDNILSFGRKMLGLYLLRDTLCNARLLRTVRKDGRPVFCTHQIQRNPIAPFSRRTGASICALPIHGRRIMRAIKELWDMHAVEIDASSHAYAHVLTDEFAISDHGGIKFDPQRLRMVRRARTHFPVPRLDGRRLPPSVPNRSLQDALVLRGWVVLQKDVLYTPETARRKGGNLGLL